MRTIMAIYDELEDAYQTIETLRDAGIDRSNISLVTSDPDKEYAPYFQEAGVARDEPVEGVLAGGAIGGITGLLLGLGALAIPGIGPVVAAGPLVSGLVGAGIGATGGGLIGALAKAGIPEDEAGYYLEGIRRGGTLVAVTVMNYQADDVTQILKNSNPIDLNKRGEFWRNKGWTGFNPAEYAADSLEDENTFDDRQLEENDRQRHFYTHFDQTYAGRGYDYQHYAPAYRFGHLLADDLRYQDRPWQDIEPVVRERWERDHAGDRPWQEVKDAIRHAWEEAQ